MSIRENEVDISVVVPIYNVEEYLIECLDSINNQTKDKIQVILIDDGSPDSSGELADEYCRTHSNFECYHIENRGLGHARNYALQFVKGKYVAYIDSDDILPPDAYQIMFDAAERNGVDMVCCNAVRFNSKGFYESKLHVNAIGPINDEVTHISRDLSLIHDVTAWNKLIRVDFMKKHGFKFAENMLYEDIPATIPMHCLANKVAVVKTTTYYWRARDGATTSITQNISNLQNLYDRIAIVTMLNKFLKENDIDPKIVKAKLAKDLESDLLIFVNNCNSVPDEVANEVLRCVGQYIDEYIDDEILSSVTLLNRQKYEYVIKKDLDGLRNLLYNQSNYSNAPVKEENSHFFIDCSDELFTVENRDITRDIQRSHPKKYVKAFYSNSTTAKLESHIYFPKVNIADSDEQKVEAFLLNSHTYKTIPLEVQPYENVNLTKTKGFIYDEVSGKKSEYNYDGTGFRVIITPEVLEIAEENLGVNFVLIKYENRVKSGSLLLGYAPDGTKEKLGGTTIISDDKRFVFGFTDYHAVTVNIEKLSATIEETTFEDGTLTFELSDKVQSVFLQNSDGEKIEGTCADESHFTFDVTEIPQDTNYTVCFTDESGKTDVLYSRKRKSLIRRSSVGVVFVSSTKNHKPDLLITPLLGVVAAVEKDEEQPGIISIKTVIYGKKAKVSRIKKVMLGFEDDITKEFFTLKKMSIEPQNGKIETVFNIDFNDKKLTVNMHECLSRLHMILVLKNKESIKVPLYAKKAFDRNIICDGLRIRVFNHDKNHAFFKVNKTWDDEEGTPHRRKALINEKYEEYRKLPLNKRCILFETFWGRKYSCNPQAIYEYIDKNYPEYECVWAFEDERHPINGHAKRVRRLSLEYYYYLATAKYLVNNVNFPDSYIKRDGQIEVHTMHGTPLKTLGLDIPGSMPTARDRERFMQRTSRWNYVVVQGEFTAQKIKDMYGVEVEKMRTGYPRTDALYNASAEKIEELKTKLNIPKDKKVVLYAPTWRVTNSFDMQLDIDNFRNKLGDDCILLVRIHYLCAAGYTVPADNKVIFDMGKYHSIEDLYLVSDILITDYSSAMFDYAIINKPMIFYLYDIKEYAENLRGMYFDIEKEAPGPLVYDNDQLVNAIANIDAEMEKCADRTKLFYDTYVNYECGNSSQKVVEILLEDRDSLWNKALRCVARIKRKRHAQNKIG